MFPKIIRQRPLDRRTPESRGPMGEGQIDGRLTLLDLGPSFQDRFCTTWLDGHGGFNWTASYTDPVQAELDYATRSARGR